MASYQRQLHREPVHMSKITAFLKDEVGATAIEYGLIAAGVSIVIIVTRLGRT
jgi:Flp pilus assembly protein TadG